MRDKVKNYEFRKVSNKDVEDILTWKYEGVYSFFDNDLSQGKIDYIKSSHGGQVWNIHVVI